VEHVHYQTRPRCFKTSKILVPIFAGDSITATPASCKIRILSWAVPFPQDIIAVMQSKTSRKY
jgi:hypothetical protein